MFVLDTNVVSELRKAKAGKANVRVVAWATGVAPESVFISAITVLELELGVLMVERRDQAQGVVLRRWLDVQVLPAFTGRVLPVDEAVARCAARLQVPDRRAERDVLIAATASVHGMTVVTRNVGDFEPTGVEVLNPWSDRV